MTTIDIDITVASDNCNLNAGGAVGLPNGANLFYVSDSFTIDLSQPGTGPYIQYYQPGTANQSGVIPPGASVEVSILSCSMVTVPISFDQQQGINTDVFVGLYDTATNVWQNRMPFGFPYGTADNGIIMNQVTKLSNNSPRAFRDFGDYPLVLWQRSPSTGSYQVGAGFQFNFGTSVKVQYEYHIHGYWIVS